MLNTTSESMLTLAQAARLIPSRTGHGIAVATVWRWMKSGIRGVRLETVLIGGTRYTSHEAIERFIAATTAVADGTTSVVPPNAKRDREIAKAKAELDAAGI